MCMYVYNIKQQRAILQEISPQPSYQHPTPETGLDPRLKLIDTFSCEPMVFPRSKSQRWRPWWLLVAIFWTGILPYA